MTAPEKISPSVSLSLRWARIASALVMAVGVIVLAGWIFDVPIFKSILPNYASMKANTAICLFVLALGLRLQLCTARSWHWAARFCGAVAAVIGAVTLSEYLWGWDAGIDLLIINDTDTVSSAVSFPGRMAIATTVVAVFTGASLILGNLHQRALVLAKTISTLLVAFSSLLAVVGYFYGATALYTFGPYASVAIHTALSFLVLSTGILCATPNSPLMQVITGHFAGSIMARRLLFFAIIVPLVLGALRLWGERAGHYDTAMGVALLVLSNVVIFSFLIWNTAHSLNRAAVALSSNEERMRLVMQATNDGIWDWDLTTRRSWSNETFEAIMGYDCAKEGDNVYNYWQEHLHPDDRERTEASLNSVLNSTTQSVWTDEFRMRMPDGRYKSILIRGFVSRDSTGKGIRMVGSIMDMTPQKKIEEELRKARDMLDLKVQERTQELSEANAALGKEVTQRDRFNNRLLIQYAVSKVIADAASLEEVTHKILALVCTQLGWQVGAVWRLNVDKKVLQCTDFWHTPLQDFPEFEKITRTITFDPDTGLPGRIWSLAEPAWIRDVVTDVNFPRAPYAQKDGLHGAFGFPILVNGQVIGAMEFFHKEIQAPDVDLLQSLASIGNQVGQFIVRKEAEEKVKQAMAIREEFTSMVSHELRSPLSVVHGGIEMVLDGVDGPINDKQKKHLDASLRNVERLIRLINNVLDLKKIEAGRVELHIQPQEVNRIINDVVEGFQDAATKKGLHLELELGKNLPRALCDKDAISQVITNLLSNAMKFTSQGKVTVKTEEQDHAIRITVADEGVGIRKEDQHKLFQTFSQIRHEGVSNIGGSGLGLVISKKIVEANHGAIGVESAEGHGSSFYVTLPTE